MSDLSNAKVLPNLPDWLCPEDGDPIPDGLVGSTIIQVGTLQKDVAKASFAAGGGLVIDYRPHGCHDGVRRVVFAISDRGMWVVYPRVSAGPAKMD